MSKIISSWNWLVVSEYLIKFRKILLGASSFFTGLAQVMERLGNYYFLGKEIVFSDQPWLYDKYIRARS
jgi:uncharacterized membrane protein YhfC